MTEPAVSQLHMKLSAILGEITTIAKTGHNVAQNYDFVTEVDVLNMIRPKLASAGISVAVSVNEVDTVVNAYTTRSGAGTHLTTIKGVIYFSDSETGERISFGIAGQGVDSQDKGLPKAITMAVKYGILKTFLVPTGDDSEATNDEGHSTARHAPAPAPAPAAVPTADDPWPNGDTPTPPFLANTDDLPFTDPPAQPAPAPAAAPQPARTGSGRTATPGQQRLLVARKITANLTDDEYEDILKRFTGTTSVTQVTMDDVDAVKEAIDALGAHKAGRA